MPKYDCCVPNCHNSHRDQPATGVEFYCIPKDRELRQKYTVILKNDSLELDILDNTRICSIHWVGGKEQNAFVIACF